MAVSELRLIAGYYISLENVEQRLPLLQRLDSKEENVLLDGIRHLRISLKCSRQQKLQAIKLEIPKRLFARLTSSTERPCLILVKEIILVLTSVGTNCSEGRDHLLSLDVPSVLFQMLETSEPSFIDVALKCLRTVFCGSLEMGKIRDILRKRPEYFRLLVSLMNTSSVACEIACEVMTVPGDSIDFSLPVSHLLRGLTDWQYSVKRACLKFIVSCCQNETLFHKFVHASEPHQIALSQRITIMLDPSEDAEVRILSLSIMTSFLLNDVPLCDCRTVTDTILPMLARFCGKERPIHIRVSAAEILATLLEDNPDLQEIASYTDQLMVSLACYLKMPSLADVTEMRRLRKHGPVLSVIDCGHELKRSCFLAFSALASSNEWIRKRVAEVDGLVGVAAASCEDKNPRLAYSALRLLHCLSRSIQELRTIFKEYKIWETVLNLLKSGRDQPSELTVTASALIANLGMEFSACRSELVNPELWMTLGVLLSHREEEVVKNIAWTFMNLTYMAEPETKKTVADCLPIAAVQLLLRHSNQRIVICTLGLFRNLLHSPPPKEVRSLPPNPDVAARVLRRMRGQSMPDYPVAQFNYAKSLDVMESPYSQEALTCILNLLTESTRTEVLEQCFCVLANVCASSRGRQLTLSSADSMEVIKAGLSHSDTSVAISAVTCLHNLALPETDSKRDEKQYLSSEKRQSMIIDMNLMSSLTVLLSTKDEHLLTRVKIVIQHLNASPSD